MKKNIAYISGTVTFLLSWEIAARIIGKTDILPVLSELFVRVLEIIRSEEFIPAVTSTVIRGLFGFVLTLIIALATSALSYFNGIFKAFLQPWVLVSRTIPVIALTLIALIWFAPPYLPVFIAFITMFPIIYQGVLSGFESIDHRLIEMSGSFGKTKWHIFSSILLPGSIRNITESISTTLGFGWRAVIIGEVLAQPVSGIGTRMKSAQLHINMPELLAWTLVAIVISYLFDIAVKLLPKVKFNFLIKKTRVHFNTKVSSTNIIQLDALFKSFDNTKVLENFSVEYGRYTDQGIHILDWPSGKGKTTLLNILCKQLKVDKGLVQIPENFVVAYSFQDLRLVDWMTVEENILYGTTHEYNPGLLKRIVTNFNIEKLLTHLPGEISGGQQQLCSLARALMAQPDLLLLDEPLNGLDTELKYQVIRYLFSYFVEYNPIVVWATHENLDQWKEEFRKT